MLIRLTHSQARLRVAELCCLCEKLRSIPFILEDVGAEAGSMQKTQFVRSRIMLCICRLGGSFQPLDTFSVLVVQSHVTSQTCRAESDSSSRMILARSLAEELHSFGVVSPTAPAKFVAECCAVAGFRVTVLAGAEEERECG